MAVVDVARPRREMKIIRNLEDLPHLEGSVVTIGNFDGLHIGHRRIVDTLSTHAKRLQLPGVAVTFDPHPLEQIDPSRAPKPLSTLDQRIRLIEARGIDLLFVQQFNEAFSRLTPQEFIARYLIEGLAARLLCVGHNFRFGHQHQGSVATLRASTAGFEVVEVEQVTRGGHHVSSSRVRQCLADGDVSLARRLLGRCYEIEGQIVAGEGRGRREIVPTLNMQPLNRLLPGNGVYCTQVRFPEEVGSGCPWFNSVTNVGTRPTFDGEGLTIETFVPGESIEFSGGAMALKFLRRLRDEQRFDDAEALRDQIRRDVDQGLRFFRRLARLPSPEAAGVLEPGREP